MAAFNELNWGDLDVFAILIGKGIATIEPSFRERSLAWVQWRGYELVQLDFAEGIGPVVAKLGAYFRWTEQFGYELEASDRNLARLRDGFWYDIQAGHGLVLEIRDFESAFAEDLEWSRGFLSIVSEHSHRQLALGRRFFVVVHVSDENSPVVGAKLGEMSVPYPYPFPFRTPDA